MAGDAPTLAHYKAAFDAHLDAVALERRYDSRLTIFTWVNSKNSQYAAEAQAYSDWQTVIFGEMEALLKGVENGSIEPPTIPAFIASLTAIEWP